MVKVKDRSKNWEQEAKAGLGKITDAKKERDEAKEEVQHSRLAAVAAGDAKALTEDKLARVKDALVVAEEARTSLLLDIKAARDEVSSLYSQAGKDKEAMEEDYQKALELIFAYG